MNKLVLIAINIILILLIAITFIGQMKAKKDISSGFDKSNIVSSCILDSCGQLGNLDELNRSIQSAAAELEMNILIYVAGDSLNDIQRTDYEIECFADDISDEFFGEDSDSVCYYIDASGRSPAYDYISTSGKAWLMYQSNIEYMFDYINQYLPPSTQKAAPSEIIMAANAFLKMLDKYYISNSGFFEYQYDRSSQKYVYMYKGDYVVSESRPPVFNFVMLIIASAVGLIIMLIVYFAVKRHYRFKASQSPNAYISNEETRFTRKDDVFMHTHTSKHRIESSGSNGGGGHRSGGGHHHSGGHGGGGRHR